MDTIKDSSFLQPIPENASAHADQPTGGDATSSSSAQQHHQDDDDTELFPPFPRPSSSNNSSTEGVRNNRPAPSIVSDTQAVLADRASTSSSNDSKPTSDGRQRRRRFCMTGFAVTLTIVVMVAIVLIIFLGPSRRSSSGDRADGERPPGSNNTSATLSPARPVPTVTAAMTAQVDRVLGRLSSSGDLSNASTPQHKARHWLLTQDLLLQDVLWEGEDRLAQRYIAQLFFRCLLKTTNNTTSKLSAFLQADASECDWPGLTCPEQERGHVLTAIQASGLNLTGSLPSELFYLSTLQQLDVSDNQLTGTIPSNFLESWIKLYSLDVSQNELSGTLPASLWALTDLRYLYLNENSLTGTIDDTLIAEQPELVDVWIHNNDFIGTLPELLFQSARKLQTWSAYDNRFSGSLPSVVVSKNLTFFDVSYNELNGTLDSLAGGLLNHQSIETLYIDHNKIEGSLPLNLDTSLPIRQFWIHRNRLSGSIPSNFGLLWDQLGELRIHKNNLVGNITDRCRSWPLLQKLEADCKIRKNGKTEIECDCCTDCQGS